MVSSSVCRCFRLQGGAVSLHPTLLCPPAVQTVSQQPLLLQVRRDQSAANQPQVQKYFFLKMTFTVLWLNALLLELRCYWLSSRSYQYVSTSHFKGLSHCFMRLYVVKSTPPLVWSAPLIHERTIYLIKLWKWSTFENCSLTNKPNSNSQKSFLCVRFLVLSG